MKILLDTCAFLWLTTDNTVYLSSVLVWEIIVKHELGKLPLPDTAKNFIKQQCERHYIEYIALDENRYSI